MKKSLISILTLSAVLAGFVPAVYADSGDIYCEDFDTSPSSYYIENYSSKITKGVYSGIGGKTDNAYAFKADNAGLEHYSNSNTDRWAGYGAYAQYNGGGLRLDGTKTISVQFYNSSNGSNRVRIQLKNPVSGTTGNFDFLESDGSGKTYVLSGNKVKTEIETLSVGKWHELGLTANYTGGSIETFIDGKSVGSVDIDFGSWNDPQINYIAMNALPDASDLTLNGTIAYDRLRIYEGTYVPEVCSYTVGEIEPFYDSAADAAGAAAAVETVGGGAGALLAAAQYRGDKLIGVDTAKSSDSGGSEVLRVSLNRQGSQQITNKYFLLDKQTLAPLKKSYTIGQRTIANVDFEENDGSGQMFYYKNSNLFERIADGSGNYVLHIKSVNNSSLHAEASGLRSGSDIVIYEAEITNLSAESNISLHFKDTNLKFQNLLWIQGTTVKTSDNKTTSIVLGEPYKYTFAVNYYTRRITCMIDGAELTSFDINADFCTDGGKCDIFRIQPATGVVGQEFYLDNYRVYENAAPAASVGDVTHEIDLSAEGTVFESDTDQRQLLSGYKTIHMRSGVAYDGEKKTILASEPKLIDGEWKISADDADSALGLSSGLGAEYVSAAEYAAAVNKTAAAVDAQYNSGLVVFGDSAFDASLSDEQAQKLNDFAFYLRPSPEDIGKTYAKSDNKNVHPRIMATAEDFAELKRKVAVPGSTEEKWYGIIKSNLEGFLESEPFPYLYFSGSQILATARAKMSLIHILGVAYWLEEDAEQKQRIADRAWAEMKATCEFKDWYPSAHLNPCEMGVAMAIGYDWFYDALTDEQRRTIEEAVYDKLFYYAWQGYLTPNGLMTNFAIVENNHNTVCNGSIILTSLAFSDAYPEVCNYLTSNAIRGIEYAVYNWAPNGSWFEGMNYWDYAMRYTVKYLSSMQTALGTELGLDKCEGLSTASDYLIYFQCPGVGSFNYGDCQSNNIWSAELLWLSNKYNVPSATKAFTQYHWQRTQYDFNGNSDVQDPVKCLMYELDGAVDLALQMLWLNPELDSDVQNMELDKFYANEDSITMRSSWGSAPTFVGIHAGQTNIAHSHLDAGSFMFAANGFRWSGDPGMGSYASEGYWDSGADGKRWYHYQCRAEAHSTIMVNPDGGTGHKVDSYAPMTVVETGDSGGIVTVDMSDVLSAQTDSALRGFWYTDGRKSLVIRDELKLKNADSEVDWFMCVPSSVTMTKINDTRYRLGSSGKYLYIDISTESEIKEVVLENSEPLPQSPVMADDVKADMKRFAIRLTASGDAALTVKLTPSNVLSTSSYTPVSNYAKPISEWKLNS